MSAAGLVVGPISGFLAARAFGMTAGLGAALLLSLAVACFWLLHEPRVRRENNPALSAWKQLQALFRSGTLWSAAGMLFLVGVAPGFITPLYYYQTDTLKFSSQFIGNLAVVSSGLGMLGALIYGHACRRLSLRPLLIAGILFYAFGALCYLGYRSRESALLIEGVSGLAFALAALPLYDLAARATPAGSESLGYALMMSLWNLAVGLSDLAGSWLFEQFHRQFMTLVWLNAGTTLLALVVVPFLPRVLLKGRDEGAA